jgi:hypothetical protein
MRCRKTVFCGLAFPGAFLKKSRQVTNNFFPLHVSGFTSIQLHADLVWRTGRVAVSSSETKFCLFERKSLASRQMTSPDDKPTSADNATSKASASKTPKAAGNGSQHDKIFRHAFSLPVVARQFLKKWLPDEMVAQINWKTLRVSPVSGINEALAERREDIVYRISIDGCDVHFYVLIEHQTKITRFMAQRFLEETVLVWQQDTRDSAEAKGRTKTKTQREAQERRKEGHEPGKLPLVVPILLHPGPGKWGKVWRLADLINVPPRMEKWARTFMPDCGFIVVELAGLPLEKLADGHLARAILGSLQGERLGMMDIRKISRLIDELFTDPNQAAAKAVANQLWTYLLRCSELKNPEIGKIVAAHVPTEHRKAFMSTAERLEHEGRMKGRAEGRAEGRVAEQHKAIIEVLDARFDRVPEGLQDAIKGIGDLKHLRNLLRVAARCASIEDFSQSL